VEAVEAETCLTSVLKNRTIAIKNYNSRRINVQTRLLHAIISGIIIAIMLGFSLIPTIWQMINQEPTFEPKTNGMAIIGIIASATIIAITLLSLQIGEKSRRVNKQYFWYCPIRR